VINKPIILFFPEIPNMTLSLHRAAFLCALRQIAGWRGRLDRHAKSSELAPRELRDVGLAHAAVSYRPFEPFRHS
jgi:hypothetical protein